MGVIYKVTAMNCNSIAAEPFSWLQLLQSGHPAFICRAGIVRNVMRVTSLGESVMCAERTWLTRENVGTAFCVHLSDASIG